MDKKPYYIVCIKAYEFEGKKVEVGDLSLKSFGRLMPEDWAKATQKDIDNYINKKRKYKS